MSGTNIDGSVHFCYLTQDGIQSPTLVVWPGDHLRLTLTNLVQIPPYTAANTETLNENYGTNLHFHGMNVSPAPGQDFAVTLVAPGMSTTYELDIPVDHPTGLFWSE
jgi:FtsP/CotA-like multicopper oxidase with cupredoxin domain